MNDAVIHEKASGTRLQNEHGKIIDVENVPLHQGAIGNDYSGGKVTAKNLAMRRRGIFLFAFNSNDYKVAVRCDNFWVFPREGSFD